MRRANELQVQIDDVHACLGSCAGCVLTPSERKVAEPAMSASTMALARDRLVVYAKGLRPLERVNVTFGVADHMLVSVDHVVAVHSVGSDVVRAGEPSDARHSGVFFTTSLIGKERSVVGSLREIERRTRGGVPLMPLVVLDPRLMRATKFGPQWRAMVLAARDLFGEVDLSINLSDEAVEAMSPEDLFGFAKANGFGEVTVNWTPTVANAGRTFGSMDATRDWLTRFDALLGLDGAMGTSFRPVISRTIDAVMCGGDGGMPGAREVVMGLVPETVAKSIQVDHLGFLMPKFEAVGDTPHAERYGFATMGHLSEASVATLVARSMARTQSRIIGIHSRGACLDCPVTGVCAGTGFHVATQVARLSGIETDGRCPHVARGLIEGLLAEAVARDASASRGLAAA